MGTSHHCKYICLMHIATPCTSSVDFRHAHLAASLHVMPRMSSHIPDHGQNSYHPDYFGLAHQRIMKMTNLLPPSFRHRTHILCSSSDADRGFCKSSVNSVCMVTMKEYVRLWAGVCHFLLKDLEWYRTRDDRQAVIIYTKTYNPVLFAVILRYCRVCYTKEEIRVTCRKLVV